nr:G protein-coupled receptor [Proales similis]
MNREESENWMDGHELKRPHMSIVYISSSLCLIAMFLTVLFFVFNFKNRNFRLIKMSSPNINSIICFGCLLLYLTPLLSNVKSLMAAQNRQLAAFMCQANAWILPIASTIVYGAMLGKAWRIYKIFETSPRLKRVIIRDEHLVSYLLVLVLIDSAIAACWQYFDPLSIRARFVYEHSPQLVRVARPDTNSTNEPSGIVHDLSPLSQVHLILECRSKLDEVWITVFTLLKLITFMYGIYLAWLIRNVQVPSMNDAKYLLMSTFAIIVAGLGSMSLMQLLRDWPDVVQAFLTIGVILSTCSTQCLIFVPKIRLWYEKRNDDNLKISLSQMFLHTGVATYNGKGESVPASKFEEELCELLHENNQLKAYLKQKEEIINVLHDKVRVAKEKLSYLTLHPKSHRAFIHQEEVASFVLKSADSSGPEQSTETHRVEESEKRQTGLSNTDQIRHELDEVEQLTNKVRHSISTDLSNTRRYSPLIYDFYRKQLELAKSIQCTYNIQGNGLFDAMTLMRKCLRDQCETVHNPEYLTIEAIQKAKELENDESQYRTQIGNLAPQLPSKERLLNRLMQLGVAAAANHSIQEQANEGEFRPKRESDDSSIGKVNSSSLSIYSSSTPNSYEPGSSQALNVKNLNSNSNLNCTQTTCLSFNPIEPGNQSALHDPSRKTYV